MPTFFRQLSLYLRKNRIQKTRAGCQTACEVGAPILLVGLFALLYAKVGLSFVPAATYECDVVVGENAKYDFVYLPRELNVSRTRLALVGDAAPSAAFAAHAAAYYPGLPEAAAVGAGGLGCTLLAADAANGTGGPAAFPPLGPYLLSFPDEPALEAYIGRGDYGAAGVPRVHAAVVWTAAPPGGAAGARGAWAYRLRVNASSLPADTRLTSDDLSQGVALAALRAYEYASTGSGAAGRDVPGFVPIQTAVDRFILNARGSANDTAVDAAVDRYNFLATWGCARGWEGAGGDPALAAALAQLDAFLASHALTPQRVRLAPFPTPGYHKNDFYSFVSNVFALIFVMSFFFPSFFLIRGIVVEKETKLREGMKMMGMADGPLVTAWYVTYGVIFLVAALAITATVKNSFFPLSDGTLLFLFFWLFGWASTALCFLLSTFFSRAKLAAVVGAVLFIAAFFPYFSVNAAVIAPSLKAAASLSAPVAFGLAIDVLSTLEGNGVGVTWAGAGTLTNGFSLAQALNFLALDTLLYTLLALYLGSVLPQEFGVPLAWWFPLSPAYWAGRPLEAGGVLAALKAAPAALGRALRVLPPTDAAAADGSADETLLGGARAAALDAPAEGDNIEPPGPSLRELGRAGRCVAVRGLTKTFPTPDGPKTAVDDLSLDMYEGQIFVLLGHNGAGKTTTMSMLTGLIPPSSGDAFVAGASVRAGMADVRKSLGVCPQHDVLWPDLTVEEHLQFFAGLKDVPPEAVPAAVADVIREVGLTEKRAALTASLSGGMKRKLSVGIALIGGSKFVVLDEPTSGMDPYSRRSTWQILQNAREGRVLLLTTHFMDEADILGDRIAVMAHGKVRCCGGSMYLKRRFGVGYNLTVVKAPGAKTGGIVDLVAAHVPAARLLSDVGAEVVVQVPLDATPAFPPLFAALEAGGERLGAASYGISVTTMEEVFLKVAEEGEAPAAGKAAPEPAPALLAGKGGADEDEDGATSAAEKRVAAATARAAEAVAAALAAQARAPAGGLFSSALRSTFLVHLRALLLKRLAFAMRDRRALLFQLLIPVAALLAGLALLNNVSLATWRAVPLGLGGYNPGLGGGAANHVPYAASPAADALAAAMAAASAGAAANVPGAGLGGARLVPVAGLDAAYPAAAYFAAFPNGSSPDCTAFDYFAGLPPLVLGESSGLTTLPDIYGLSQWLLANRNGSEGAGGPGADGTPVEGGASRYAAFLVTRLNASAAAPYAAYTALSNSSAYHAAPAVVNLVHSALASALSAAAGGPPASIAAVNAPLPFTSAQRVFVSTATSFVSVLFIVIAVSFIPASFAQFVVKEREVSAKHQQLISGVSIPAYWVATYAWDLATYALPCGAAIGLIAGYNTQALTGSNMPATVCLFVAYGLAVAPFTYVTTFAFASASTAQTASLILNLMCLIVLLASFVMNLVPSTCDADAALRFVWRLLPGYALGDGLLQLTNLPYLPFLNTNCGRLTGLAAATRVFKPFDAAVAGWPLAYLLLEAAGYLALAVGVDYALSFPSLRAAMLPDADAPLKPVEEDGDVAAEAARVDAGGAADDVIVMDRLRKVYAGGKVAVRQLSFGVPAGEVFGFLGINGAGKTTTMKMVTGDVVPTSGTGRMGGHDILRDQMAVRRLTGYTPQFDALLELLSVREHLQLYARIKGVPEAAVPAVVAAKLAEMDLVEYENKLAGSLSGGNKRKLSVGIALIGAPPLVFLDEPSTGMDPVARRMMWRVISRVATESRQCSIILTTHSMEEAEALCTRIGIMVGGRLRCLGSTQHLKSKFGSGYLGVFKLAAPTPEHAARALAMLRPFLAPPEGGAGAANAGAGAAAGTAAGADVEGGAAALGSWRLGVDALAPACAALGDASRARMVSPTSTGWPLAAQLQREGSIEAAAFAEWWASESLGAELHAWVGATFAGAALVERHGELFRYRLPAAPGRPLSAVFAALEGARGPLRVAEYSLSQVSLEIIFNNLAAEQEEEKGTARGMAAGSAGGGGGGPGGAPGGAGAAGAVRAATLAPPPLLTRLARLLRGSGGGGGGGGGGGERALAGGYVSINSSEEAALSSSADAIAPASPGIALKTISRG